MNKLPDWLKLQVTGNPIVTVFGKNTMFSCLFSQDERLVKWHCTNMLGPPNNETECHLFTSLYTYIHMYIHIYIYMCMYNYTVYIYICIHTCYTHLLYIWLCILLYMWYYPQRTCILTERLLSFLLSRCRWARTVSHHAEDADAIREGHLRATGEVVSES